MATSMAQARRQGDGARPDQEDVEHEGPPRASSIKSKIYTYCAIVRLHLFSKVHNGFSTQSARLYPLVSFTVPVFTGFLSLVSNRVRMNISMNIK